MKIYRFFIYGLIGWCIEIIWTGFSSMLEGDWSLTGTTYLWMLPIYGLGILLEPIHDHIRNRPWFLRGLIWLALILLIEFSTGGTLALTVGSCPWDYSGKIPYSVLGLIRLDYAPAWFVLGLLFERLHDWLKKIEKKE